MKKFTKSFIVLICIVITSIGSTFAQTEVTVDPGFNTLYDAVVENPGATLILLRGEDYVIDKTIKIIVPTIIKGEAIPAATKPAVISFFADPGALPAETSIFDIGADFTIQNAGLLGFTADEQQLSMIFRATSADTKITVDGCIIQGGREVLETSDKANMKYLLKNNKIFNNVNNGFDNYGGFGSLWGGNGTTYDSYNNTVFMAGRIFNCGWIGPNGRETLNHNTYVNLFGELFYPAWVDSIVVTNNILYNANARGYVGPRTQPEEYVGDFTGDFPMDTLIGDIAIFTNHTDSTTGNRHVVIENNLRFTDSKILAKHAAIGATTQPLYGATTASYIAKYNWSAKNNLTEGAGAVDPLFKMAIPDEAYENQFLQMEARRRASLQVTGYPYKVGWWPGSALKGDFIWPLPFDFTPTNPALSFAGKDGYPLGDLNWYGKSVVDAFEAGAENPMLGLAKLQADRFNISAYPNPVKSSSKISYSISNNSKVRVSVYNTVGVEVANLVNASQVAGKHEVDFDASGLPSGIYICKIQVGSKSVAQKISVVK